MDEGEQLSDRPYDEAIEVSGDDASTPNISPRTKNTSSGNNNNLVASSLNSNMSGGPANPNSNIKSNSPSGASPKSNMSVPGVKGNLVGGKGGNGSPTNINNLNNSSPTNNSTSGNLPLNNNNINNSTGTAPGPGSRASPVGGGINAKSPTSLNSNLGSSPGSPSAQVQKKKKAGKKSNNNNNSTTSDGGPGQTGAGAGGTKASGQGGSSSDGSSTSSSDDDDDDEDDTVVAGQYNPADYTNLKVSPEIRELFQYITRYRAHSIELETRLKAFIPDFIPAIGEVDAFLKIPRPDGKPDGLGLTKLDEPTLNPSDPAVLDLQLRSISKHQNLAPMEVRSAKNENEVKQWVQRIADLHRTVTKPSATSVSYTKKMPDIESLMQVFGASFEEYIEQNPPKLADIELTTQEDSSSTNNNSSPTSNMDPTTNNLNTSSSIPGDSFTLKDYIKVLCVLLDIPVHDGSLIESLHVLFTLYAEFKSNQHFAGASAGGGQGPYSPQNFSPGPTDIFLGSGGRAGTPV